VPDVVAIFVFFFVTGIMRYLYHQLARILVFCSCIFGICQFKGNITSGFYCKQVVFVKQGAVITISHKLNVKPVFMDVHSVCAKPTSLCVCVCVYVCTHMLYKYVVIG